MTYRQTSKDKAKELQARRRIWRAFFVLKDPIDPDSFISQLRKSDLTIERSQVYDTFALLTEYGFADRRHNENIGMTFYTCR
jgi:Fe2+ or Zn2+ uptake regulation protein